MWHKLHLGISEDEATEKGHGYDLEFDWREHPVVFNKCQGGAVVIASIPSGKGIDLLAGKKCEIWLFPDGTYSMNILPSWLPKSEFAKTREGYHKQLSDGCIHHPHCSSCPFPDCIAKGGEF